MSNKKTEFRPLITAILLGIITSSPALAYELIDLGANVAAKAINNLGACGRARSIIPAGESPALAR